MNMSPLPAPRHTVNCAPCSAAGRGGVWGESAARSLRAPAAVRYPAAVPLPEVVILTPGSAGTVPEYPTRTGSRPPDSALASALGSNRPGSRPRPTNGTAVTGRTQVVPPRLSGSNGPTGSASCPGAPALRNTPAGPAALAVINSPGTRNTRPGAARAGAAVAVGVAAAAGRAVAVTAGVAARATARPAVSTAGLNR